MQGAQLCCLCSHQGNSTLEKGVRSRVTAAEPLRGVIYVQPGNLGSNLLYIL